MAKPAHVSSADVLLKLQSVFATSELFAPLLASQPKRTTKDESNVFRMGHGGTLDPLASGVLICGIGRGTKHLQRYLACNKSYETVVQFGSSTDSYDCTGKIVETKKCDHVTKSLVEEKLALFRGTFRQVPPAYSALKINGIKAVDYVRQGKELPRELDSREMHVDECVMLEWQDTAKLALSEQEIALSTPGPAARIRLTVCSGFYVRSFAHDLGIACDTRSHMTSLVRTRQADFTLGETDVAENLVPAITYADLDAGEETWGSKLRPQLQKWVDEYPLASHINGRDQQTKRKLAAEKAERPRQRFRGDWVAEDKKERIKQQGGKVKGKNSQKIAAAKDNSKVAQEGVEFDAEKV